MIALPDNRTCYFDVDDTLIEWKLCGERDPGATKIEKDGHVFFKKVIQDHVEELKNQKMTGNTVVVWSAGGGEWAATVVRALDLEKYVDVCITKPDFYYDDKDVSDWFPKKRFYHSEVPEKFHDK
jgi:predicted phosphatase